MRCSLAQVISTVLTKNKVFHIVNCIFTKINLNPAKLISLMGLTRASELKLRLQGVSECYITKHSSVQYKH